MAFVGGINVIGRRNRVEICGVRRDGRLFGRSRACVIQMNGESGEDGGLLGNEENGKMFEAAMKQDVDGIEAALEAGASAMATDPNGRTAMHFVAGLGVTPTIKFLVERGADVNAKDVMGLTPLHMAAGYARPATVELLLDIGADANMINNAGESAYDLVSKLMETIPEKRFFMKNKKHESLSQIRLMLTGVTTKRAKLEEEDEARDSEEEEGEKQEAITEANNISERKI